jgi:hypothetical protein
VLAEQHHVRGLEQIPQAPRLRRNAPALHRASIKAHRTRPGGIKPHRHDLADHGQVLLATLGTRMQAVAHAGPRFLHADTSAFALFGDYPDTAGPTAPVQVTYGHPAFRTLAQSLRLTGWYLGKSA